MSTTQATKLWIFIIFTGQQKRDISYDRHLLLHNDQISLRETWLSLPSVICNPRGLFTSKEKIPWPIQTNIIYTCYKDFCIEALIFPDKIPPLLLVK